MWINKISVTYPVVLPIKTDKGRLIDRKQTIEINFCIFKWIIWWGQSTSAPPKVGTVKSAN